MRAALLATLLALTLAAPASAAARFPRGFLWGPASSGFQTEMGRGRNLDRGSDWWAWVHNRANIRNRIVSGDLPERGPGHWALYRQDARLARRALHSNAYRMGIEWSRIFPRSTRGATTMRQLDRLADQRAVRHYAAELRYVRRLGMTPFVTISHFTLPRWIHDPFAVRRALASRGPDDPLPSLRRAGWLSRSTIPEFRKYAAYLAWKYRKLVTYWTPINEPSVVAAFGYVNGVLPGNYPPGAFSFTAAATALLNEADANAAAYDAVHRYDRHARVGLVQNMIAFTPADPSSPADVAATAHADQLFDRFFLDAAVKGIRDRNVNGVVDAGERIPRLAGKADFIGVNYYFRGRVSALGRSASTRIPLLDFLPKINYSNAVCPTLCSDFGAEIFPAGFRQVLRTAGSYRLPVYVTENGIADATDRLRPAYLTQHIAAMHDAIAAHEADVRGYFQWSLVDNFEWSAGYAPKFGLYSFNARTLKRTARPSAALFGRIARTNALP